MQPFLEYSKIGYWSSRRIMDDPQVLGLSNKTEEVPVEIKAVRRELGGSVENRPRTGGFLFCGGHGGGT